MNGTQGSISEMVGIFKLLADQTRLTMIALLKEQEMCVCDIVDILQTTQPNVSQHLKKLKLAGLVHETRRSQWMYYSLSIEDKPFLHELINQLPSMSERIAAHKPNRCC